MVSVGFLTSYSLEVEAIWGILWERKLVEKEERKKRENKGDNESDYTDSKIRQKGIESWLFPAHVPQKLMAFLFLDPWNCPLKLLKDSSLF